MIRYRSTNGGVSGISLADALLTGQAPDRGLFMPETLPSLDAGTLESLRGASYAEVAATVLRPFVEGTLAGPELDALCADAYDFAPALEQVDDRRWVMRLDTGPTASFKDFAAQWMGRMMGRLVRERDGRLVILTATSGDTGSAVANAFAGVAGIEVAVLFPVDEVSDRQRRQMTTIGGNVSVFAVDGKFDDCQAMVKRAFADPELADVPLSSANSINIGRLLPQSVYYVWGWLQTTRVGGSVTYAVPCGNFGNLVGGLLAHRSGLPIERWVVATNANDEVPRFFETQHYEKVEPSRTCLSNAMNVGHPSNLARLVDLYGGMLDHSGRVTRTPDFEAIRRDFFATSVSDADTRAALASAHAQLDLLLEPHGAVGWAGLERYDGDYDTAICLETAHPAKFPDEVRAQTGVEPALPASLQGLEGKAEQVENMTIDYDAFRALIRGRYA